MNEKYKPYLTMPHPEPRNHTRMPKADRAAQFMPFAALKGYEQAIEDKEIRDVEKPEISEDMQLQLQEEIASLMEQDDSPYVEVRWFRINPETGRGEILHEVLPYRRTDVQNRILYVGDRCIEMDNLIEMHKKTLE